MTTKSADFTANNCQQSAMTVTVTPATVRGRKMWCVTRFTPDGRKRQFFESRRKAEASATGHRSEIKEQGEAWLDIPHQARADLVRLYREAADAGVRLDRVWEEWRAGVRAKTAKSTIALGKAIADCVSAKRAAGRRERYLTNLAVMLNAFARGREELRLAAVAVDDVRSWVASPASLNTRATRRNRLSTLFTWAVRAGHLRENPCDALEPISYEPKPIFTLTVEQSSEALTWTRDHRPRFLAWLALALLAGLRPEEADKVEWSDIADGTIRLDASKAKLRERRIVHLTDSARAWIDEARRLDSELPVNMFARRLYIEGLRDRLGFKWWPVKILRKTCASNLLAAWQDAGRVADELGHSVGILLRNYRDLVPRESAERWLVLMPTAAA